MLQTCQIADPISQYALTQETSDLVQKQSMFFAFNNTENALNSPLSRRQRAEPLTFSTCPTGAEQQPAEQRSNPNDSFVPQKHVEATGCCRL